MSVIVLGMEMPESCLQCILFAGNGCKGSGKIFPDWLNVTIRPTGCPLRPLPEKHGRLIDQDEILRAVIHGDYPNQWIDKNELLRLFRNAPTIVEAEVENYE